MKWAYRLLIGASLALVVSFIIPAGSTHALGLKVAPLEYKTTLKKNEKQRGFIDVSNPYGQPLKIQSSVQAFRQINDDGGLQFYDDPQISAGIVPGLKTFDLGPKEAVRVFFTIDGSKLPEGDIYAAVFFTIDPKQPRNGVGQSVRVGTIISIVNTTPGPRQAEVTKADAPFLQLTSVVEGTYSVKNTAKSGGFYPSVTISGWPGGKKQTNESSLVFAGRERSNNFRYDAGYGLHRVDVSFGNSKKSVWVLSVAPWMLVLVAFTLLIVGVELLLLRRRRKNGHKKTVSKPPATPKD